MNGPTDNHQPGKICDAAVGVAIITLALYFIGVWQGWLPPLRKAGAAIGAYAGVVAVWSFYDTVIRTQRGWSSALGPVALVVAGLGAFVMAFQH